MNTCSTHVKEKSTLSAKPAVFASSPPASYFRNCLPKHCSQPSAIEERLDLNYVCFASRRRRFDPGHLHQLFLMAKHLPASATQSVGAYLRPRRGWRAVTVEGHFAESLMTDPPVSQLALWLNQSRKSAIT